MPYVLDTNVFIEAKDYYYMFDVCPGFWEWLVKRNGDGSVYSVQAVNDELQKGSDKLAEWANERGGEFFLHPNASTARALETVASEVRRMDYEESAVNGFFNTADYHLVAEAYAKKYTVVTREAKSNSARLVKIPNVCDKLQITCIGPFEMLSAEKARFVLG
ncbi:MAG: DUF4411 family protein [Nitrosopumilaceae archaeon]|nr:DUF4411 family protein [Nitrosopumilaceae archaeon]